MDEKNNNTDLKAKNENPNEPDWTQHRIGGRDREGRFVGLTHVGDDWRFDVEREVSQPIRELAEKEKKDDMITVRDVMDKQKDYHLIRPDVHPHRWRFVLNTTERFIKDKQSMSVDAAKKSQQADKSQQMEEAMCADGERYCSLDATRLLRIIQDERRYMQSLQNNDGQNRQPLPRESRPEEIDESDQFTADNWVPRNDEMIRLTGTYPYNAEPSLKALFDSGFITPTNRHYVRNRGAVPFLLWETHKLEITTTKTVTISMDELKNRYPSISIPVVMACSGSRRKELNMIKRTRGFDSGPGTISCVCWRGVLLRDVLLDMGISEYVERHSSGYNWVNFEGADQLEHGKYSTCISLEHVMNPHNDVLLAFGMNDVPLPADHGYPLRVVVPGFIGARSVKWLSKIWISDHENDSYYHIHENRLLPSIVVDKNGELAQTLFRHPSTICNEQVINSSIARPTHGEKLEVRDIVKGKQYRIEGIAYAGGGREVQMVEISLDGGKNWLYCTRRFPEAPIRHNVKFWTWLFWYVDVDVAQLLRAEGIAVRAWDSSKNVQPEKPTWNILGVMNNCWYVVKPEIIEDPEKDQTLLLFRHPCQPGTDGWMKPSNEDQIMRDIRRKVPAPSKQFTREELEQHYTEQDCWIVIDGKVIDATNFLSWHPGGPTPIMAHAGMAHQDTSEEFGAIHDDDAYKKISERVLGVVTDKTMEFMKGEYEKKQERARQRQHTDNPEIALKPTKWTQVRLVNKVNLTRDTNRYTFALLPPAKKLGLPICQHLKIGFHFLDRLVIRPFTPIRPIVEDEDDGTFDVIVKTYYPKPGNPGGTLSNILDCLPINEEVEIKGPEGDIQFLGRGCLGVKFKKVQFQNITVITAGTGTIPGYQLSLHILRDEHDTSNISIINSNETERDIVLYDEFNELAAKYPNRFRIVNILSHPGDDWKGERGHVTADTIHKYGFSPEDKNIALVCGPPEMIKKGVLPNLFSWGYKEGENLFGW